MSWASKLAGGIRRKERHAVWTKTGGLVIFLSLETMGSVLAHSAAAETCLVLPQAGGKSQAATRSYSLVIVPLTLEEEIQLTSVDHGVSFDLDGDGRAERTAWTPLHSRLGFLALDRDGDGRITSGKELIGNATEEQQHNGFDVLRALAPNDAILDEDDALFNRLLIWEDSNHNGASEEAELHPATKFVTEIGLGYVPVNRLDDYGNRIAFQGWATVRTEPGRNPKKSVDDGRQRNLKIYDVLVAVQR